MCTLILLLALWAQSPSPEKPDLLIEAEASRMSFGTAWIEWTSTPIELGTPRRWTSRFSGRDHAYVDHGLPNGSHYVNEEDSIGHAYSYCERRVFLDAESREEWSYTAESTAGERRVTSDQPATPYWDIRTLGMSADLMGNVGPEDYFRFDRVDHFTEFPDESPARVVAALQNGVEVTWYLEPAYSYQPVRVTLGRDGQVSRESVCTYREWDGHYFPATIEFRMNGEIWATIEVTSAEFDRPSHPKKLTPAILAMPCGVQIKSSDQPVMVWSGDGLITIQETGEAHRQGLLDFTRISELQAAERRGEYPGRFPRSDDGPDFGLPGVPRAPGLWEEYVRRFIRVFDLDAGQKEHAWRVHGEWQTQAKDYLASRQKRIDKTNLEAKELASSASVEDRKRLAALIESRDKLLAPVEKMFLDHLRPELIRIPNPKQKEAVLAKEKERNGSSGLAQLLAPPKAEPEQPSVPGTSPLPKASPP
ncbi:MAG: hypothetical protein IT449_09585 [Phycisphaerales bacterium]|nr:hypothetical protein [Phycisphaerales bacterium]